MVIHLPSSVTVQKKYHAEILYKVSTDDEYAIGIRDCDPMALRFKIPTINLRIIYS